MAQSCNSPVNKIGINEWSVLVIFVRLEALVTSCHDVRIDRNLQSCKPHTTTPPLYVGYVTNAHATATAFSLAGYCSEDHFGLDRVPQIYPKDLSALPVREVICHVLICRSKTVLY